jgi:hypothetical protein
VVSFHFKEYQHARSAKQTFYTYIYIQDDQKVCIPDDYNTLGYLAQSECLAADRQGQGDTRFTLTPSVIPNSNYVIMVSN